MAAVVAAAFGASCSGGSPTAPILPLVPLADQFRIVAGAYRLFVTSSDFIGSTGPVCVPIGGGSRRVGIDVQLTEDGGSWVGRGAGADGSVTLVMTADGPAGPRLVIAGTLRGGFTDRSGAEQPGAFSVTINPADGAPAGLSGTFYPGVLSAPGSGSGELRGRFRYAVDGGPAWDCSSATFELRQR